MSIFGFDDPLGDYHRYVAEIRHRWPREGEPPSDELMTLMEEAVERCPHMADLWLMRAELIHHYGAEPYQPDDILLSLETAARIDADSTEAHEGLAWFYEDTMDDPARAERSYLRAVELGGGPWVYTGLARVLAKQGRWDEAAAALDPAFCPYHDEPGVEEARRRLAEGDEDF